MQWVMDSTPLSHRELEFVQRRYLDGEKIDDIAARMGVSRQNVNIYRRRALTKIKRKLEGKGYEYTK